MSSNERELNKKVINIVNKKDNRSVLLNLKVPWIEFKRTIPN